MLKAKADSPIAWWNKPLDKRSRRAILMIGFGGVILFEALLPRPLLTSRDWRFLVAFGLFVVCGAALFFLLAVNVRGKRVMNLFSLGDALYVLFSCLGMLWVTAFTEYKRINPSFDSYASAVFGGLVIAIVNAASFKDQAPTE